MRIRWTNTILLIMVLLVAVYIGSVAAQSKRLTFNQVYRGEGPELFADLPQLQGWLDNDYYLEQRSDPENRMETPKIFKIHAETAEESVFLDFAEIQKKSQSKGMP